MGSCCFGVSLASVYCRRHFFVRLLNPLKNCCIFGVFDTGTPLVFDDSFELQFFAPGTAVSEPCLGPNQSFLPAAAFWRVSRIQ
jgi:hypothetical protein